MGQPSGGTGEVVGIILFRCVFLTTLVYMVIREILSICGIEIIPDKTGSWWLVGFYVAMVAFELLHLWRDLRTDKPGP